VQIKVTLKGDDLGTFNDERITLQDAFAIKAASGLNLKPFFTGLNEMDPLSVQTLVWFLKHKKGEQIPLAELDFVIADLDMTEVKEDPSQPAETEATSVGDVTTPSAS
jgi:hypothetical protein